MFDVNSLITTIIISALIVAVLIVFLGKIKYLILEKYNSFFDRIISQHSDFQNKLSEFNDKLQSQQEGKFLQIQNSLQSQIEEKFTQVHKRELDHIQHLQTTLRDSLSHQENNLVKKFEQLTSVTDEALLKISNQVDNRLSEGLEKTNRTFTDIVKRLALIDDAQKQLSELSSNVVGLQEILIDKRARGAFGEVQLKNIVENILPPKFIEFQSVMSNGTRADCILKLPPPNGTIAIDSKFPLENYQRIYSFANNPADKKSAQQQFKQDIKKHISDIATKYIIPGETANCAIMFIPAESIFAEIHANLPELVTFAQQQHVWLTSPTTIMAVLTTANTVIKDAITQKHIQVIQNHIQLLAKDFSRFEQRMDKLNQHIQQAQTDVTQAHTSAKKIASRFQKIEQARIDSIKDELETC